MISPSQLPPRLSQCVRASISTEPTAVHMIGHSGRSLAMFNMHDYIMNPCVTLDEDDHDVSVTGRP